MTKRILITALILAAAALAPRPSWAQTTVSANFTGASVTGTNGNSWTPYLGACLTAGDNAGAIPACVGSSYYGTGQNWVGGYNGTLPDPVGEGALRFTNGTAPGASSSFDNGYNQAGGIISNFTLPTNNGVKITFTAVSYAGNSYDSSSHDGADGISFFLLNGATKAPYDGEFDVGAFGGSLGYDCSNVNNDSKLHPDGSVRHYDGVVGGYLGLGIDEFGNFMNQGDNSSTGAGQREWDAIGVRGAGSINWYTLNNDYPSDYPSGLSGSVAAAGVQDTCKSGYLWQYGQTGTNWDGDPVYGWSQTDTPVLDYPEITYRSLASQGVTLADESATKRPEATPITYSLTISQNDHLSISFTINGGTPHPVLTNLDMSLKGETLPSSFRFGFAGSTGGGTNVHELLCFRAGPSNLSDTSLGVNQKQASKIASGEQAFLAFYNPNTWTGDLTANNLLYDSTTNLVTVSATANWDASCVLTGVASGSSCATTGQAGPITAESPSSRVILTWNGTQGTSFEWKSLTSAQQSALDSYNSSDPTEPQLPNSDDRLLYLRGDRSNEIDSSGQGIFRYRLSVLGDIVDSNPTWVGPPNSPYSGVWKDYLYPNQVAPEDGSQSYNQFIGAEDTRLNVVYVGANDGMVHGFRAGAYDASGNFVNDSATPNDGEEVLAYMPAAVLQKIHTLTDETDYSNPYYSHEFYVDATPASGDLYYENAWHTWLVGGLGAGGSAIYALDVTNPANFSEANAASIVMGEWTPSTITCANVSNCGQNLGDTYGTPVIRRLHDGMWAVIFGNGYNSATGDAGIFIMTINPTDGSKTFYYLSTGQAGKNDGIAYVSPVDLDGDNITDFVYAGDLNGNVWRFNLTSDNPLDWHLTPTPVFTDPNGNPITTKVNMQATVVSTGEPRVLAIFGTGRKVPMTPTSAATYASGVQHVYGVWDSNMTSWNTLSPVKYATLTSPPTSIPLSELQQQTLTPSAQNSTVLDDTNNSVCWADVSSCSSSPQFGWYFALPNTNEQVIYNTLVYQGTLYVNTTIPPVNNPAACSLQTETGDTIAVSATTGGVQEHLFPAYTDDPYAAGQLTNGSGTPFVVLAGGGAFVLTQTVTANSTSGSSTANGPFTCSAGSSRVCESQVTFHGPTGHRLTWTELR